jgi:hypothetical protein
MFARNRNATRPLPREFLEWQVALRRHTAEARRGMPHAGVAPLVTVRRPGAGPGFVSHSVICGVLPHPSRLAEKTEEFRKLYESASADGARALYDRGIAYLQGYYRNSEDFDPESLTTLLPVALPLVDALRADPQCALVFHVFDLEDPSPVGRLRCVQIDARAEVLRAGAVFENVWWHNALFHGAVDEHAVVHFRHERSFDVGFGILEPLD